MIIAAFVFLWIWFVIDNEDTKSLNHKYDHILKIVNSESEKPTMIADIASYLTDIKAAAESTALVYLMARVYVMPPEYNQCPFLPNDGISRSVLANGNMRITGNRKISINGEEQTILIHGIVRASDITADNTVLSYNISDAEIVIEGSGLIDNAQKPGWLTKLFHWLF